RPPAANYFLPPAGFSRFHAANKQTRRTAWEIALFLQPVFLDRRNLIMENPVIIIGAGGLGKAALDIFTTNDVVVYGFLDDKAELKGKEIGEVLVLGSTDDEQYLNIIGKSCEACIAVDDNRYRKKLVKMLNEDRKVQPVNAVHNKAYIAPSASIGHGNFINAG